MNAFQVAMRPYPGLERRARTVSLPAPAQGMQLFFYDTGEGKGAPVLLIHGLGDEADTWRHVLPLLGGEVRAIAPDLPGFGRSDQARRSYTIPFFAATMLALLDHLAIPRAALVGHSTGAVIAQAIAMEHPERVERLTLIGGSLAAGESKVNAALLAFLLPGVGEWAYTRLRRDPQAAYRSLEPYYHDLTALPQAERDFLFQRVNERVWSDGQRRGFLSTLRGLARWLPAQQKGLAERLRGWTIPTTVVWGEDDRIMPVASARALVEMLPSARLVIVPGAGHNVQQEQPQAVAAAARGEAGAAAAVAAAA